MRRQFLRDLGDDAPGNLGMKNPAKIAQYFRWRDDHKFLETIGVGMAIEGLRQFSREPLLGDVMPIGFFHRATGDPDARAGASGTIRALLARRWVVTRKDLLDDKRDVLRAAFIAQEESLLTVADKNKGIMGNAQVRFHGHFLATSEFATSTSSRARE